MYRAIWGNKLRIVSFDAPEDETWVRSHPLFEVACDELPERAPETIGAAGGCRLVGAFAGIRLVALAVAEDESMRILTMVGRLYYRCRRLDRALIAFIYDCLYA